MSELSLPHPIGANYLYSASGENNIHWPQSTLEDGVSQRVAGELGRMSRDLAEVPHDETGLDSQRVARFLEKHELVMRPFVGVDEVGQEAINKIIDYKPGDTQTTGSHITPADFIYVLRCSREAANGPGVIEASLVHEEVHANQPYWDILSYQKGSVDDVGYYPLRNGFKCLGFALHAGGRTQGNYFEEGFAQLMEHKYTVEELGLTNGFLNMAEPVTVSLGTDDTYLLPGCYLYKSPETGRLTWSVSANAAYGMQLLIVRDPAIFPAMLAARKGVEGLREFARLVNALDPGLYPNLRRHPYAGRQFMEATRHIIERLYDGNQEEALAAAREQDSREELIAA